MSVIHNITIKRGSTFVFIENENRWRMITHGEKELLEEMGKPKDGQYKKELKGKLVQDECTDADCSISGCKHSACYWLKYVV